MSRSSHTSPLSPEADIEAQPIPNTSVPSTQPAMADWSAATVAEPLGFADDNFNTVGALVLKAGTPTIFSLQPGEDFELNTDIIHQWKLIFQDSENHIIGDADYHTALKELHPYVLDQQNGSILVRPLSDIELDEIHSKTVFI